MSAAGAGEVYPRFKYSGPSRYESRRTGTIDGYWGLLKRGIMGSFHQVSIKHLHRYLSEFQFRWNNRESQEMLMLVVAALVIGSSLPYTQLVEGDTETAPEADENTLLTLSGDD